MRVAVIGNGILGTSTALFLKESCDVVLYGPKKRRGSGTKAAGAMINVFSELECGQLENEALRAKFEMGLHSLMKWPEHLKRIKKDSGKDILTAQKSCVFKNKYTTPYELEQFNYLKSQQETYPNHIQFDRKNPDQIILPTEFSVDSKELLEALDAILLKSERVDLVNYDSDYQFHFDPYATSISISTKDNQETFDAVVIAAGSFSERIFHSNPAVFEDVQPLFYGIGNAFNVTLNASTAQLINLRPGISRTLNRGGACGFHALPNRGSIYFGATSTVHSQPEFNPRVQSINVLSKGLLEQFDSHFETGLVECVVGFRPTTLDSYPLLGKLNDHQIFLATGTKRDGITSSIAISQYISQAILNNKYPKALDLFSPQRELISYFNRELAVEKAAQSMASGRIMHDSSLRKDWDSVLNESRAYVQNIYSDLLIPKHFGVHPEMLGLFRWHYTPFGNR
ncbi:MAG: hypothetical protein CMK59_10010 [Proteobacteria bacterium]|nr:hypothetical protein [Pseudomonadota bacterium]